FRFFLNMTVVYTVVRCFYYPKAHRRDYLFTFLLFAVCIFLMIFLMEGSKLKIGAALGLFAIFGIIRYRTEAVPIREMTYLFFVVTISVVNAMAVKLSLSELLLGNLIFLFSSWALEHWLLSNPMESKYVKYDNIALITPDRRAELIEDLKARLGLDIVRVEVGSVDFLKDMALIRVYYITEKEKGNSVDHMTRLPKNYE
ncbi:MAG: DUF4956 domain-containing protein, partial [Bacteroidaceae bacterium]|nr:DUF4956 domain-containing protein [Bacteroidaceae bacterium]